MSLRHLEAVPRVKLCGLRDRADVSLALAAGADALGFVHHAPSARHLEPDRIAAATVGVAGRALVVLVVVDRAPDALLALARAANADAVQLCGDENARDFRDFPLPILRRVGVVEGAERELEAFAGAADAFVLDAPHEPGGTGRRVDARLAAALAQRAPCLLAGGLDPHNVSEAVARVRPAGVDASSGLERAPGRKDPRRMSLFTVRASAALSAESPARRRA